jgi:anhydro-N-acetylmuramic acid kinase
MTTATFIGLMSGTSMDGVDAVLVDFDNAACTVRLARTAPYPDDLAAQLRAAAADPGAAGLDQVGDLDMHTAHAFAAAARDLMTAAEVAADDVIAIGSHGQTVLHRPDADPPFSLQLGDPGTLAALTGVTVVADFRNADLALGGQGAPLVPAFHRWAFGAPDEARAVVNIGGIANVTHLEPTGDTTGYDTGPGNVLLDMWCRAQRDESHDADGAWAAGGSVDTALLAQLESDPYFGRRPPKSTGTDYFNADWLRGHLRNAGGSPDPRDVQATLSELTARTIAAEIGVTEAVAVCGGGAFNGDLLRRLRERLRPRRVDSTAAWGIEPEWVEAVAFAWLARQRLRGEPTSFPAVTGARKAVSLGGVYLPPQR